MATWLFKQREALKQKGARYWLRAVVIIGLGVWAGDRLSHSDVWLDQRRQAYRWLNHLNPRKSHPRAGLSLILIEDNEYWLGELAGRKPIRRDYLAKLLRAAAQANPKLIALDFDLRSPSPNGNPVEHDAYRVETDTLLRTVAEVGAQCPIVLPRTIGWRDGMYTTEADIYDGYDFGNARVLKGYIGLPRDERLVPAVPLQLYNGERLDSFARAIVRSVNPDILKEEEDIRQTLPYADFMNLEAFTTVSAGDILRNPTLTRAKLEHRVVIIGAHWHSAAVNRKSLIDLHGSPNGDMPGTVLHANYVEAILDSRVHWGWDPFVSHLIEGLGAMLIALLFALEVHPMAKAAAVAMMTVFLVMLSAVSLLFFGLVFDFFVPVVSAIGHGVVERVLEWRDAALIDRRRGGSASPGLSTNPPTV